MNFEKSKVLLKKINALHQAADEVMGVSALEKDLMLQYVRDFYEAIKEKNKKSKKTAGKAAPISKVSISATPPVEQERIFEPAPKAVVAVNSSPTQPVKAPVEPIVPANQSSISEELSLLFLESEKEDHGSRYTPGSINDIGKSMGINDKILTINELFKGDQGLFNKTIEHLNGLSSFNEAKEYLASGVAEELKWSEASNKGKAIRFIKLMRRRYSS